jgi:hypothetical protein
LTRPATLLVVAAAVLGGAVPPAAQGPPLGIALEAGAPRLIVTGVLQDPALEEAVRSGLPLRMRFTVELWRDRFFDGLVGEARWTAVLAFEPLERRFLAGFTADSLDPHTSYSAARASLERDYTPDLRPQAPGRYYYIATLEIETLSLSDLDELERWLSGELRPAVRGGRSVGGALGSGVKRLLIRVLDLPARRFQARSERFLVR